MLSLNEMSITIGNINGIFDIDNDVDESGTMEYRIDKMINDHKNSFLAVKNNFSANRNEDIQILQPSPSQVRRKKKILRIMSNRHKRLRKVRRYQNMSRMQCSLLHQTPKKISAC